MGKWKILQIASGEDTYLQSPALLHTCNIIPCTNSNKIVHNIGVGTMSWTIHFESHHIAIDHIIHNSDTTYKAYNQASLCVACCVYIAKCQVCN